MTGQLEFLEILKAELALNNDRIEETKTEIKLSAGNTELSTQAILRLKTLRTHHTNIRAAIQSYTKIKPIAPR